MKACILLFSPSGHTRKVAEQLWKELVRRDVNTQLLDVSGVGEIQNENNILRYLENNVKEHDILFIGAPVYAGHFESNMIRIIKNLPPVNKKWGRAAVPFITYGGIHSSIALMEAGELILKTGRINVAGLKIASFHTLTTTFERKINTDKPGEKEYAFINEFMQALLLEDNNILDAYDITAKFDYITEEEKQLYLSKSQDDWHQPFRKVTINEDKCIKCRLCIKKCPVTRIRLNEKEVIEAHTNIKCILCAECFHNCPSGAVQFPYINVVKERLNNSKATELEKVENAYFI